MFVCMCSAYIAWNTKTKLELHCYSWGFTYTCFIPVAGSDGTNRTRRSAGDGPTPSFQMATTTTSCLVWDEQIQKWTNNECEVTDSLICHCLCFHFFNKRVLCCHKTFIAVCVKKIYIHLTPPPFLLQGTFNPDSGELDCTCKAMKKMTFANSFHVPVNKIDFSNVFLKFSPMNQAAVMSTLILILLIYLVIVIWARRQDRKDLLKVTDTQTKLRIWNTSIYVHI